MGAAGYLRHPTAGCLCSLCIATPRPPPRPARNRRMQGWETAHGYTYLHRPIEASLRFTPAFSRCAQTPLPSLPSLPSLPVPACLPSCAWMAASCLAGCPWPAAPACTASPLRLPPYPG